MCLFVKKYELALTLWYKYTFVESDKKTLMKDFK